MKQLLLLALLTPLTHAQNTTGIKAANLKGADTSLMTNHDPAVEKANFDLLPGYEVNLFAHEPMLANPIHMVWDQRGRLWVACSWAYPQLKPGEKANDKIIILEDTNNDGKADKSTVFAEGLYMPTGIELSNGGCFVAQTPDVFFLKDTDGDSVADVKELALTGFGIEDSHHSISAWRRGPGGWIYFQEGIFLHSQVETQHGMVRNYGGGVYQYNPRTHELRVFAKVGVGNPWGHVFDRWGQSFIIDNSRVSYLSPSTGNSGAKVPLARLIQTEKQCGGDFASGTHLPEDIRGQLLTGRFKSRTIIRYEFIESGAGYSARVLPPLIASRHPNFRPVDCKIGPDGAVYVADWYNSIINHAQHDFRDPRRDNQHGRIWRITATGRPLTEKPKIAGASIADLLEHLKSPEAWTRHQARLELSERDADEVADAVNAWTQKLNPADANHARPLVEAMWALQNVERPSEKLLQRVLEAKDGHARAAAARVIRYWHKQLADPVAMIAKAAADPFPRVRLEAILSAGFVAQAAAFPAALNALDHPRDKFVDIALPQTTNALASFWKPAMQSKELKFTKPEHRAYAEKGSGIGFTQRLGAFLRKRNPNDKEISDITSQLVSSGDQRHIGMVLGALTRKSGPPASRISVALLGVLERVGRGRNIQLGRKAKSLQTLLNSKDDAIAAGAATNLGVWKLRPAGRALIGILRDSERSHEVRQASALALGELRRPEFTKTLIRLSAKGDNESRYLAVLGLAGADLKEAASAAAALMTEEPSGKSNPTVVVSAFLTRDKGAALLADALEGNSPHPAVIDSVADFHRRTGQLTPALAMVFQSSATSLIEALLKENRDKLVADVEKLGDPARGEMVYRRRTLACTTCHSIGSAGPAIGPNLVAVGAAATTSYMVESILEPNKSIAEHYENMMIVTTDGMMRMGVITFKSKQEVVIRDAAQAGREVRIPTKSIKQTKSLPSLMPAGLADQLKTRQEFLDLAKFVSVLGRPGLYANDERPVIRKWRVVAANQLDKIPADNASWIPAYSKVNGELPASDLDLGNWVFAKGFVNVLVAGKAMLKLNETKGLGLWIDGKKVADPSAPLFLKKGRTAFVFSVDRTIRGAIGLTAELVGIKGSPARFKPEGGI